MRKLLPLLGLILLAGCGMTDAQRVYTAKTTLDAATLAATHYAEDLPRCSPTQAPPCSRQDLIDSANVAVHRAGDAVQTAEDLVRKQEAAKANPLAPAPAAGTVAAQARLAESAVTAVTAITQQMGEK